MCVLPLPAVLDAGGLSNFWLPPDQKGRKNTKKDYAHGRGFERASWVSSFQGHQLALPLSPDHHTVTRPARLVCVGSCPCIGCVAWRHCGSGGSVRTVACSNCHSTRQGLRLLQALPGCCRLTGHVWCLPGCIVAVVAPITLLGCCEHRSNS